MTQPGTPDRPVQRGPAELPSIRKRRPLLYWTLIVAVVAMVVPLLAGIVQGLL